MQQKENDTSISTNKINFRKLFNMNNILSNLINYVAYLILIASIGLILYLSFIESIQFKVSWSVLGIYSGAAVILTWTNWNTFYKKNFEKVMARDIAQQALNKYSIHARYYFATKDWKDDELQACIDKFNLEFKNKWLSWVEKEIGAPIESTYVQDTDVFGNLLFEDEEKKIPKLKLIKGIKDLKYREIKGLYHKMLAWRIKTHHYPSSGYKTSMELLSLLSFQDSNLNRRKLQAHKYFFFSHSARKLLSSFLLLSVTSAIIPEMISGAVWTALLKLAVALVSLIFAVFMGSANGIRGARLKLFIVEDACADMERWANKKPLIDPYQMTIPTQETIISQPRTEISASQAAYNVFNNLNSQNK